MTVTPIGRSVGEMVVSKQETAATERTSAVISDGLYFSVWEITSRAYWDTIASHLLPRIRVTSEERLWLGKPVWRPVLHKDFDTNERLLNDISDRVGIVASDRIAEQVMDPSWDQVRNSLWLPLRELLMGPL